LFWQLDATEIADALSSPDALPARYERIDDPHVTLLYVGGGSIEASAAKSGISPKRFTALCENLERIKGTEVVVTVNRIIFEDNIAVAEVSLPSGVPCSSRVPHVTLGTRNGVPPRYSNDVLAEVAEGRREGITIVEMPGRSFRATVSLVTG